MGWYCWEACFCYLNHSDNYYLLYCLFLLTLLTCFAVFSYLALLASLSFLTWPFSLWVLANFALACCRYISLCLLCLFQLLCNAWCMLTILQAVLFELKSQEEDWIFLNFFLLCYYFDSAEFVHIWYVFLCGQQFISQIFNAWCEKGWELLVQIDIMCFVGKWR